MIVNKDGSVKIATGFQGYVSAQQLYNALIICSEQYVHSDLENGIKGQADEKYNVVKLVRAMIHSKEYKYHAKTTKVLDIIHNQLCSEGY